MGPGSSSEMNVGKESICVSALENGIGLRCWVTDTLRGSHVQCIRCATFAVGSPGLLWLTALASQCNAKVQLVSDVGQANPSAAPAQFRQLLSTGRAQWRLSPARPGSAVGEVGWFHPKVLLFDDRAAVVGSANLTGRGLGLNISPHHFEMSIGLSGEAMQGAIEALLEAFGRWWENSSPIEFSTGEEPPEGVTVMAEYVAFNGRPAWGIGQLQTSGGGIFGQAHWLALSDVSPADPEHLPARIQVPEPRIESAKPVPWATPGAQLATGTLPDAKRAGDHFLRLCAYWLQSENRQGQLDSVPVLPLRHQASLVDT